jgi:hypothetical protein
MTSHIHINDTRSFFKKLRSLQPTKPLKDICDLEKIRKNSFDHSQQEDGKHTVLTMIALDELPNDIHELKDILQLTYKQVRQILCLE